jgi:hypothetical protein
MRALGLNVELTASDKLKYETDPNPLPRNTN